jgi:hypothetical protein
MRMTNDDTEEREEKNLKRKNITLAMKGIGQTRTSMKMITVCQTIDDIECVCVCVT